MLLKEISKHARRPVTRNSEYGIERGTYVGLHFDEHSKKMVEKIVNDERIPNPIDYEKIHTTLVYSKKPLPDFEAEGDLEEPIEAEIDEFEIFKSKEGNNVLVAKLKCPNCTERHQNAREQHGATHDYDEY